MKRYGDPALAGAYDRVADALRDGQYRSLPLTRNKEAELKRFGLPECLSQSPNEALAAAIKESGVQAMDIRQLPEAYTDAQADIEETWFKALNAYTVYGILNESNLLAASGDNEALGHSSDNGDEFVASVANVIEQEPQETGEALAKLPHEVQLPIIKAARVLHAAQVRNHQNDPEFVKAADAAYNTFFSALGARIPQ